MLSQIERNQANPTLAVAYRIAQSFGMSLGSLVDLPNATPTIDVIRVDDDHWHRVPPDGSPGTPYRLDTHPFTAQRVFDGQVVHRDREELEDSLIGTVG